MRVNKLVLLSVLFIQIFYTNNIFCCKEKYCCLLRSILNILCCRNIVVDHDKDDFYYYDGPRYIQLRQNENKKTKKIIDREKELEKEKKELSREERELAREDRELDRVQIADLANTLNDFLNLEEDKTDGLANCKKLEDKVKELDYNKYKDFLIHKVDSMEFLKEKYSEKYKDKLDKDKLVIKRILLAKEIIEDKIKEKEIKW